jgi:enolase-phosphatase E1
MGNLPPAAVLIDLEGTAIPHDFVGAVLRPYALEHLLGFVAASGADREVQAALADAMAAVPGQPVEDTISHWLARDLPAPPLQTLQGLLWRAAMDNGTLDDPIFPDVGPTLRRWSAAGVRLAAYSADSAVLQRLIFGHAPGGDLSFLFKGFFDTRVGMKAEPDSFSRLAIALAVPTFEVAYLSAIEDDLDAAAAAGMRTCQVLRDGGTPSERHPCVTDFPAAAAILGLPSIA